MKTAAAAGAGHRRSTTSAMALVSGMMTLLLWGGTGGGSGLAYADTSVVERHQISCEEVRVRCAFGAGCSVALHNYFAKCDKVLQADSTSCPESCLYALVALTSTEDGKRMLDCTCRDRYCEEMKTRVEVCRPLVIEAAKNETVVSCELAQWICLVDPVCTAALGYYHTYCKRMLLGMACTERCLNSVEILQRQEKASKMNRCRCTGKSAVECLRNKERMVRLCYNGGEGDNNKSSSSSSHQGSGGGNRSGGGGGGRKNRKKHRPRMFDLDPDRAEVEFMMANADYEPDGRHRYNATTAGGIGDGRGSASAPSADGFMQFALVAAVAVFLVMRSSLHLDCR